MKIDPSQINFQISQIKRQKEFAEKGNQAEKRPFSTSKLQELERKEEALLRELRRRDREVKAHEMAHLMAAGPYALSGAQYKTVKGPDGRLYAVAGEVKIDTSPERDPEKTLEKARIIKKAALAPRDPSPQDRLVALKAAQMEAQALAELAKEKLENQARVSPREAAQTYKKFQTSS